MRPFMLVALVSAVVVGCSDGAAVGPSAPVTVDPNRGPHFADVGVEVMTRNLDLGANLDPILLSTDPSTIPVAAGQIWGQVIATNFSERAGALAREIARQKPELVGLQEVALWRIQTGPNPFAPAIQVVYDFERLLLDSLHARGAAYDSVITLAGADVQLPAVISAAPLTIIGVRMTLRDAIIARHGVPVWDATGGDYNAAVSIGAGAATLRETRSWVSTRALVGGSQIRFVTTHLTQQRNVDVQTAQAKELLDALANEHHRLILVGDFNSAADGSQTPTYGMLRAAGFIDVWSQRYPHNPGYTCCMADDLRNTTPQLDQRLDLILVRDPSRHADHRLPGLIQATITGIAPSDRTASGLWPSDHGGVAANLLLAPPAPWWLAQR